MGNKILHIAVCIATHIQFLHAVVQIQAPAEPTIPLRAKIYGVNKDHPFLIQDYEKPYLFRSFDNDTLVNKYSWKYVSRARKDELGYILLGYEERDKDDLRKAGADLWDASKNQLTEPPPPANPAPAATAPAASTPAAPSETASPAATEPAAPSAPGPLTSAQALPAPAPATKAPAKEAKKVQPKPAPVVHTQIPGDTKTLLLELNIVCTNMPGIALTDEQIETYLPGGKVYGQPIDLINHKNCYYVAKKNQLDAPAPEIREWIEKLYGAILGPGGSLDMSVK